MAISSTLLSHYTAPVDDGDSMNTQHPTIILASSSPYRRALLGKLHLPFSHYSPSIDEAPLAGEAPQAMVMRLARLKAEAIAQAHGPALIIGSDQTAVLDGEMLGKPGNKENAIKQLRAASGRQVTFLTSLCLMNSQTGRTQTACEPFHVHFRRLTDQQIERYVELEQPLDAAGSFKSEGLGITLFSHLEGRDPNTLVGLPLIRLTDFFLAEGISLPPT